MGFLGKAMNKGYPEPSSKEFNIVVVSGITIWEHMLLNIGGEDGYYFHVDITGMYPFYLDGRDFKKYLRENKKYILRFERIRVRDPIGAKTKLYEFSQEGWSYWPWHQCVHFVKEILQAGGEADVYSDLKWAPRSNVW